MTGSGSGFARVTAAPGRSPHDGLLVFRGEPVPCQLGAAGITSHKQEGDRATPAGRLAIRRILYRADRLPPPVHPGPIPREPIAPSDLWCDDPPHADYNRQVAAPHPARAERLWRDDALYDLVCVLAWNDAPITRGAGSAIFLHAARPDRGPTDGCVAVEPGMLRRLLGAGLAGLDIVAD